MDKDTQPDELLRAFSSTNALTKPRKERELQVAFVDEEHLNNFHCTMPGGFYRNPNLLTAAFVEGETFRSAMVRTYSQIHASSLENLIHGYSEKKLSQTPEQFFDAIDIALDMCGISRDRVVALLKKLEQPHLNLTERSRVIKEIHDMTLPAYTILRIQGYSHRDLVG